MREAGSKELGAIARDELTGLWKSGAIDGEEYIKLSGWSLDPQFPEVPARLLRKKRWKPRLWGKWRYKEGIITRGQGGCEAGCLECFWVFSASLLISPNAVPT